MANVHAGHRQRVKAEFLARGLAGMPDHRVLELLLFYAIPQGDVNPLAHALLDHFGSLSAVFQAFAHKIQIRRHRNAVYITVLGLFQQPRQLCT